MGISELSLAYGEGFCYPKLIQWLPDTLTQQL